MNFLHKSKVDPLTKTHFFCLVHVIPISHLSYPPGPLVVFWETPSRNFLFFWPGLISWLHRFLKSVVSFRARPSRVISMFSSGVFWEPMIEVYQDQLKVFLKSCCIVVSSVLHNLHGEITTSK